MTETNTLTINSYPSIFKIGHREIDNLFDGEVVVQEKVDGSQISFGVIDGELSIRSKRRMIDLQTAGGLFGPTVQSIKDRQHLLTPGYIYRAEAVSKNKHNVLTYERIPSGCLVLYDVQVGLGQERYLNTMELITEANRLGFECVRVLGEGMFNSFNDLMHHLGETSHLGGCKIEGFVVKNYNKLTAENKICVGKVVSEEFKEVHNQKGLKKSTARVDISDALKRSYSTEQRWNKAIQHLNEEGVLEGKMSDMAKIVIEVQEDVQRECDQDIKNFLFSQYWPELKKNLSKGLAEHYKRYLAERDLAN